MKYKLVYLLLFLALFSCKHKAQRNIIPPDTMKEILVEIHLIDGYYMMNYRKYVMVKDSNSFYKQILKKFGYNRAQLDSSLQYYAKNPRKFDKIYDDIIAELNEMNQNVYILRELTLDSAKNLYKGKPKIRIDSFEFMNRLPFEVTVHDTGFYQITVQLKRFSDDQAKNLHLTVFASCEKCKDQKKHVYSNPVPYKNFRRQWVYQTSIHITTRNYNLIEGYLLDQDDQHRKIHQHVLVSAIYVLKRRKTYDYKPIKGRVIRTNPGINENIGRPIHRVIK